MVRMRLLTVVAAIIVLTLTGIALAGDTESDGPGELVVGAPDRTATLTPRFYAVHKVNWLGEVVFYEYATFADLLQVNGARTATGSSAWSYSDGFFAADGSFYDIDASQFWRRFANPEDMFNNVNATASGTSHWSHADGFFAADGEYYNIDASNTWHRFYTAEDMLNNVNLVASGTSAWAYTDWFLAVNGAYYNIDGNGYWHQYATAEDMLNDVNLVAGGHFDEQTPYGDNYFAINVNTKFYDVDDANHWREYIFGRDLINQQNEIASGTSYWAYSDGFFAADGAFYNIDEGANWHRYATAEDMFNNVNQTGSGTSQWNSSDGFLAADGEYYNIDANGTWHRFATAEDMFNNVNLVASGASTWAYTDGYFAVNGSFYEISAEPYWRRYCTAEDMFNNVNQLGFGVSPWSSTDGFLATTFDTRLPADLEVSKDDGVTEVMPGDPITYTIVASNAGPNAVTDVTVTDTFPAELTSVSWTCTGTGGGTCSPTGLDDIADSVDLPVGAQVTYTVDATVDPGAAAGPLINTATVSPPVIISDPDPSDNTATDADSILLSADLGISKSSAQCYVLPGAQVTYTITASNAGPYPAIGATVTDTFPATLTSVSWSCVGSGGGICTVSGSGDIADTVDLPVGGSVIYTVTADLDAGASGTLVNTATVTPPGGVTDLAPANNSATHLDVTEMPLFCDGFDSGDTDLWSSAVP